MAGGTRYGRLPLVLLAATVALEAGERQSLAQAVDGLQAQFHVSDDVISWLPAAMTLVGVIGAVPFGILADRSRRVVLLAGAMALWAVVMGFNGFATSFAFLMATRLGVGIVEANGPAAISLMADYYPAHERAKYLGLYQSGALAGAVVGLLFGGIAVAQGGWRWAFWMWVPAGVVVAIALLRLPEPVRGHQDASADLPVGPDAAPLATAPSLEDELAVAGLVHDHAQLSMREVLRALAPVRTFWLSTVALTVSQLLLVGLQFWGVEFYKRFHHLGPEASGAVLAGFGLAAAAGVLAGGYVADRLLARGLLTARVHVVAVCSIGASAFLVPAFAIRSLPVAVPFMVVGGLLMTMPLAPAEALMADVVPPGLRGRAGTVRTIVRSLSALGPVLIGTLSKALDLRAALVIVVPTYAIGGAVCWLATRSYPGDLAAVLQGARRHTRP